MFIIKINSTHVPFQILETNYHEIWRMQNIGAIHTILAGYISLVWKQNSNDDVIIWKRFLHN